MKKIIALGLAILLLLSLGVGGTLAAENSNASAKYTAQITELTVLQAAYADDTTSSDWSGWTTILEQTIKTANDKDLIINASLLSGLYTETNVKSKGGVKDTSTAAAAVLLRVKVDGNTVHPGIPIIFNARVQRLAAKLGGFGDPLLPEEIELLIGTLSANSFTFIAPDLSSGPHTVTVEAACWAGASAQDGSAIAGAVIGLGSVTIEEVRMIRDENAVPV